MVGGARKALKADSLTDDGGAIGRARLCRGTKAVST